MFLNTLWEVQGYNIYMKTIEFDDFKIKNLGMAFQTNGIEYPNTLQMFKEDLRDPLGITTDDYGATG